MYQRLILSLYLFAVVMDELTRTILDEVSSFIIFVDDIVVVVKLDV